MPARPVVPEANCGEASITSMACPATVVRNSKQLKPSSGRMRAIDPVRVSVKTSTSIRFSSIQDCPQARADAVRLIHLGDHLVPDHVGIVPEDGIRFGRMAMPVAPRQFPLPADWGPGRRAGKRCEAEDRDSRRPTSNNFFEDVGTASHEDAGDQGRLFAVELERVVKNKQGRGLDRSAHVNEIVRLGKVEVFGKQRARPSPKRAG